MSARVVRALAAALALLAVGGCASSSLEITVDLFDSDPRVREIMTPRDARQLVTDLETLLLAPVSRGLELVQADARDRAPQIRARILDGARVRDQVPS